MGGGQVFVSDQQVCLFLSRLRRVEGVPATPRQRAAGQADARRHHPAGPAARHQGGRDPGVGGDHQQDHPVFLRAAAAPRGARGPAGHGAPVTSRPGAYACVLSTRAHSTPLCLQGLVFFFNVCIFQFIRDGTVGAVQRAV